jgi:peptidoglycan/LPS O-acetylase OafA/YrhL
MRSVSLGNDVERFTSLDGLRGIAALIVLLHHGLLPVPEFADPLYGDAEKGAWSWLIFSPLHVFFAGTEAVLVFFVLSGLVLALPVLRAREFGWRGYYPARLVRLYLPVIAAVAWAALVVAIFPRLRLIDDASPWMRAHAEPFNALTPARDVVLLMGTSNLDGPLWSLRWEVIFSMLLPAYVWAGRRLGGMWFAVVLAVAALTAITTLGGAPALSYLLVFAIGVAFAVDRDRIAQVSRLVSTSHHHRVWWALIASFGVLALTARWTVGSSPSPIGSGASQILVVLGAATCVLVAFGSELAKRILSSPWALWLGTISFSLYLTHEPIVVAVAQVLPPQAGPLTVLISTPIALVIAWAFSRIVERPTHSLSRAVRVRTS